MLAVLAVIAFHRPPEAAKPPSTPIPRVGNAPALDRPPVGNAPTALSSKVAQANRVGGLAKPERPAAAPLRPKLANPADESLRTVGPAANNAVPRAPAPSAPLANPSPMEPAKLTGSERDLRLAELLKEVAEEKDPRQAERTMLTIAAYQVGNGDWEAARATYEKLKESAYPEVAFSVARNLDIVQRNQAILAEGDAGQREWLQLDLAGTHQMYGHEKAAKKLLRTLEQSATQAEVRQQASQRLAAYVSPPIAPFAVPPDPPEK